MTKIFVTALIALTIYLTLNCLAQSSDDEMLSERKYDNYEDGEYRMGSGSQNKLAPIAVPSFKLVNCYACVDCPNANPFNTSSKYCPYTNDPAKNNKCVVYAEQYIQLKKLWYVRGCASERGSCAEIKKGHDNSPTVKLASCVECEGDWCNTSGVSRSDLNIFTVLIFLVLWPLLGKFTHS